MPTVTRKIKQAITSEKEILSLLSLLNQISSFYTELKTYNYEDIDIEDDKDHFDIIYPIWKHSESLEEFTTDIFKEIDHVHYSRILWNCDTMLKNCADLSQDTLDFSPDIKRGLKLLDVENEGRLTISNLPIQSVILCESDTNPIPQDTLDKIKTAYDQK